MEMLEQGNIFSLVVMGIIFTLMILMILKIGKEVMVKPSVSKESQPVVSAAGKTGDNITAAIVAAINEYRKNE